MAANETTISVRQVLWSSCYELDKLVIDIIAPLSARVTTTHMHVVIARTIDVLIPIVALFGILGNALNLVVLTRKSLRYTMDHLEKSARTSLIALAVSDALICIVYAIKSAMRGQLSMFYSGYRSLFPLYVDMYHEGLFNVLLMCSTWLTVVMAVGRYVAVCKPLHARGFISVRGTRIAIASVFVGSVVLNLPRFWHYVPMSVPCIELLPPSLQMPSADSCPSCRYYIKDTGQLYHNSTFVTVYGVACSVVAILFPLPVLTVCNVCLVRALRRSQLLQKQYRANNMRCRSMRTISNEATSRCIEGRNSPAGRQHSSPSTSHHRITPTVIGLIVLFTLLVGPSEILALFRQYILTGHKTAASYDAYQSAVVVTNFLLLVNFAVNFVLYCVVNVQFRRTCSSLLAFCCCCCVRLSRRPWRDETADVGGGACSSAVDVVSPVAVEMKRGCESRRYRFPPSSANA